MPEDFDPYFNWLGIEPHERPLDHYRLLGLATFENRREVIQAAADQRMGYIRSFQSGPRVSFTQKLLNELATAKLCLLDAQAKSAYDAALHARLFPPAPPPIQADATLEPPAPPAPSPAVAYFPATSVVLEKEAPEPAGVEEGPFVFRLWFPLVVVASVLVIACLAWGVSKYVNRPHKIAGRDQPADDDEDEAPMDTEADSVSHPAALPIIEPDDDGSVLLTPESAQLHGEVKLAAQGGDRVAVNWKSDEAGASWRFRVPKPGFYRLEISYTAGPESAGGRYELVVDEERRTGEIRSAAKAGEFVTDHLFLAFRRSGRHAIVLRAAEQRGPELFVLRSLRLSPRSGGPEK